MTTMLSQYLTSIKANLRLEDPLEDEILAELEGHIEDRLMEMESKGLSEEEAAKECLNLLGSTKLVARQIYEAHSRGTWKQTALAALPHLLFGAIFFLNWWQHAVWLSAILVLVFATAIYGWVHGRPTWVFSWLGYSLLPVIVLGIILIYLPKTWTLIILPLYLPVILWWLYCILVQSTKRDWILASVALMPIPIIIGWYLAVVPDGRLVSFTVERLNYFTPWIGLSFFVMAFTIAFFIRANKRWLRMSLLFVSGIATISLIAYYAISQVSLSTLFGLIIVMWGVFLIPSLVAMKARKSRNAGHLTMHRSAAESPKES